MISLRSNEPTQNEMAPRKMSDILANQMLKNEENINKKSVVFEMGSKCDFLGGHEKNKKYNKRGYALHEAKE